MKTTRYLLITLAAVISFSCDQQKSAINDHAEATKDAIDVRKAEVNASAKEATQQTNANATIDKAVIEANKDSIQAQLDADKKKADAEAEAAKAKVDTEKP